MHEGPRGALSQHMHDHPSSLPLINDGMAPAHAPCSPVLVGEDNLPLEGVFRTGTQEDKGRDMPSIMSQDHRQSILEPVRRLSCCLSRHLTGIYQVVDKILQVFLVLQCGADSFGRQTRSLKSHDARTRARKTHPSYSSVEAVHGLKCCTDTEACALGIEDTIDPNLPWNGYFEWFGPQYRLEVVTSNMEDIDGSLEQVRYAIIFFYVSASDNIHRINALEHLRELSSTPSVGMRDTPKESLLEHLGFGIESDTKERTPSS